MDDEKTQEKAAGVKEPFNTVMAEKLADVKELMKITPRLKSTDLAKHPGRPTGTKALQDGYSTRYHNTERAAISAGLKKGEFHVLRTDDKDWYYWVIANPHSERGQELTKMLLEKHAAKNRNPKRGVVKRGPRGPYKKRAKPAPQVNVATPGKTMPQLRAEALAESRNAAPAADINPFVINRPVLKAVENARVDDVVVSVLPRKEGKVIRLVIGAYRGHAIKGGSLIHKKGLASLIGKLQAIHEAMN